MVPSTPAISIFGPAVQFQKKGDYVTADINQGGIRTISDFVRVRRAFT